MKKLLLLALLICASHFAGAKSWTLQECVEYALANNITLKKTLINRISAHEDMLQSQAALLPSLSATTNQNITYRPWPETGAASVQNGYVQASVDKFYYNGSYGVSTNWTVWDANRTRNTVRLNALAEQQAELDSAITANSIQEQIAQLYVQILYAADVIEVNKKSLETSRKNEERGQEFYNVGKMSRADLSQLTAQRAQDEYSVVEAESNLRNYKRQLKQLLQLTGDEEFDVVLSVDVFDEMALAEIPSVKDVYENAVAMRPEIRAARLGIEQSALNMKIASAQMLPTISFNASAITNTTSLSDNSWGIQLKNNFNLGAGFSINIPIFDNRQYKTAYNKALLQRQSYMLDLQDKQTELYSTIENYWLQAVNNQNKYKAAVAATQSASESYALLSGKFKEGLINIIELMEGRDKLIMAQQNELQAKYLAILNIDILKLYQTGTLL